LTSIEVSRHNEHKTGKELADGSVPRLQSRRSHSIFYELGCLGAPRLFSLQGEAGNETAALCYIRPAHGTPVCARPAGLRIRNHRVRIYVHDHLPSATGKYSP
jgi:hypothetical protein